MLTVSLPLPNVTLPLIVPVPLAGKRQGVIARQIGQRSAVGAVTDEVIVASGGGEGASGEGGR